MKPQSFFINNGITCLNSILKENKVQRVFLVKGKNSFKSIKNKMEKILKNFNTLSFNEFDINPNVNDVYKGIKLFKSFNPDIIIAAGGGSILDMAKLIKVFSVQQNKIENILEDNIKLKFFSDIPIVAMPTTAGSGSESTHFAVIYHKKSKFSVASSSMFPNYVILDTELVKSSPCYISHCSLFDALSQGIESLWSNFSNDQSKTYSENSISLILKNIDTYILDKNLKNQSEIILASNLAGRAINITKTTAPHALSYTLTSYFNIPHGHAVAMLMSETARITFEKLNKNKNPIFNKLFDLFDVTNIEDFCNKWQYLMNKSHLVNSAKNFGIKKFHIKFISENVNLERLKGHPVQLNQKELFHIVSKIL